MRGRRGSGASIISVAVVLLAVSCAAPAPAATDRPSGAPPPGPTVVASPRTGPDATATHGASPSASAAQSGGVTSIVDAALAELDSDEELVGQLLLLGWVGSTASSARDLLRRFRPGGILFLSNAETAEDATALNLGLDALADELEMPPLLTAIDHEGGPVQRIDDVPNLGPNRAFGASDPSDAEACRRGLDHARELLAMGFDMNLAPVLDVDTDPANPVIGERSYGRSPRLVARLGSNYIRGLHSGGIIAVGKHFPGHGDTRVDSHLELPVLDVGRDRLDRVELFPFARAIRPETGLTAIMTAHIALPRVDRSGAPATLSRPIVTGLLRERLGFQGVVMTDDMGAMRAITDRYPPDEAAVAAIAAGVDVLLIVGGVGREDAAREGLLGALADGTLARQRVTEAARRVLTLKATFGLLDGQAALPGRRCTG